MTKSIYYNKVVTTILFPSAFTSRKCQSIDEKAPELGGKTIEKFQGLSAICELRLITAKCTAPRAAGCRLLH